MKNMWVRISVALVCVAVVLAAVFFLYEPDEGKELLELQRQTQADLDRGMVLSLLDNPDKVILYGIAYNTILSAQSFHDYPIGKSVELNHDQAIQAGKEILRAIVSANPKGPVVMTGYGEKIGAHVEKNGRMFDIAVCYRCLEALSFYEGRTSYYIITDDKEKSLQKILDSSN